MLKYYFYLLFFVFFTSCKSKQNNTTATMAKTTNVSKILPFTKLLSTSHSNFKERKLLIIKSAQELSTIYSTINMTRRPGYNKPSINFNTHIVIGLFTGLKSTGGHSIKIDSIATNDKETIIYCSEINPTGMATSIITHPCFLASIPKTNKPIRFEFN